MMAGFAVHPMTRRLGTVVVSSVLASALLLGKALSCHVLTPGSCPSPKPGFTTLALAFSLGSWLTIFPLVLLLARITPRVVGAVAVPLIATGIWALFDTPTVERMGFAFSFSNIAGQVLLPWVVRRWLWHTFGPTSRCSRYAREDARSGLNGGVGSHERGCINSDGAEAGGSISGCNRRRLNCPARLP